MDEDPETSDWMFRARCRGTGPDPFFPNARATDEAAKRMCRECPVPGECLEYALSHRIGPGVWGGASAAERHRILESRRRALPDAIRRLERELSATLVSPL